MASRLDSPRRKLARASHHFDVLKQEVGVFMAGRPYALSRDKHGRQAWTPVTFIVRRNPPIEWAEIVGDVISNARAALDHLVYGLSRTKPDGTGFPIFVEPDEYVRTRKGGSHRERLLAGVRPYPDRAIIDAYQPYENGVKADPLWRLRLIANADKHRISPPGYARPRDFRIKAPPGYLLEVQPATVPLKMKNRTPLGRFRLLSASGNSSVPVKAEIDLSVGFGTATLGLDLVDIEEILARVDEIIRAF